MSRNLKPFAMGLAMGAMMLWMVHGQMVSQSQLSKWTIVLFVGAHLVVIAIAAVLAIFAARLSPRTASILNRLHRPSLAHVTWMIAGAAVTVALAHLVIHGGI